jgi:hypothetical protein
VALPSTQGGEVDLAEAARERLVVYVYPRTGTPASVDSTGAGARQPLRPAPALIRRPTLPGRCLAAALIVHPHPAESPLDSPPRLATDSHSAVCAGRGPDIVREIGLGHSQR